MSDPGQPASGGAGDRQVPTPTPTRTALPTPAAPLHHLRAAQLRTSAVRGGLARLGLGTVFLVGALAHALSPERHEQSSLFWITLLSLMSTVNVALGLRSLARVRRLRGRAWILVASVWGGLAVALLGLLLRR
jgi:Kef-type K+ transport system membrane component KefB